jgi:hypothetical protein
MASLRGLLGTVRLRPARRGAEVRSPGLLVRETLWRLAILILAGFHTWLFWAELGDGRLADPTVAFRWAWGGLILAGFLALRRVGLPLLWRRKAIVLWLFVILLHCQAVTSRSGAAFDAATLPERFHALAAPLTMGPAGMALGFLLLALLAGQRRPRFGAIGRLALIARPAGVLAAGYVPLFASRPPPSCF